MGWWRLYVDAIIGRPYHSVFIITYFVYYIFKLYCYLLYNAAFEYALITIGETALGLWRLYVDAIIGRPNHSVFIITHFTYHIFKLYRYSLYNTAI